MTRSMQIALLLFTGLAAAGCATSGVGSGQLETPGGPPTGEAVFFTWQAEPAATRGNIQASLPDGRAFRGKFIQITSTTQRVDLDPYWSGWSTWGGYDSTGFARHYSGRVIAQLHGPGTQRMRCHFQLAVPEQGPASGGIGECELSTGERVAYAELRG